MPTNVDRAQVQRLVAEGAQLVEVLPRSEYDDEHLPGAVHLPLRRLEQDARGMLDAARAVIVYCWDSA